MGIEGRRQPQHQRDQPSQRLGHRGHVGAGLADVEEDLERLMVAVDVDGDVGRAERRLFAIGGALQAPGRGRRFASG